jgi:hypothetical protein
MARQGRRIRPQGKAKRPGKQQKSDYFTQPGKRGAVIVWRKPIGNRATAKVCGVMPSRVHAKMLMQQLERAESVVKDLFLEATDDGIEALEAVLAACYKEVMEKGPKVRDPRPDEPASESVADADARSEAGGGEFDDSDDSSDE